MTIHSWVTSSSPLLLQGLGLLSVFSAATNLIPALAFADEITVVSPEYFCPYACKAGDKLEGSTVDLARAALAAKGHTIKYSNMNYERALEEVKKGKYMATPSSFPGEAVGFVFPTEASSQAQWCVFSAPKSTLVFSKEDDVLNFPKKVGVVGGYSYTPKIDEWLKSKKEKFETQQGDTALYKLSKMVNSGRISVLIEDKTNTDWNMKTKALAEMKNIGCLPPTKEQMSYIVFSPGNPKSKTYAEDFTAGINELRKSGKVKEILSKYGMTDWK
jgi:polar amino acid transport system substrate-binding protein